MAGGCVCTQEPSNMCGYNRFLSDGSRQSNSNELSGGFIFSPFQISDANSSLQSENLPNASSVQLSTNLHVSEETSG